MLRASKINFYSLANRINVYGSTQTKCRCPMLDARWIKRASSLESIQSKDRFYNKSWMSIPGKVFFSNKVNIKSCIYIRKQIFVNHVI